MRFWLAAVVGVLVGVLLVAAFLAVVAPGPVRPQVVYLLEN